MKQGILFFIWWLPVVTANAQGEKLLENNWRVVLERQDGKQVVFQLQQQKEEEGKMVLDVVNGAEKIRITNVKELGDSLFFSMPAFEASFRVRVLAGGDLSGTFIKGTAAKTQYWPLHGYRSMPGRFNATMGNAKYTIAGKWDVTITRANGTTRKAVAEFEQEGNKLTGTFLTPSADYRYLEGIVTGDSLKASSFDGDNARLFEARIDNTHAISGGVFYNGYSGKEKWTAQKSDTVPLPVTIDQPSLRKGFSKLDFTFKDLDGVPVSINDAKYRNKVVIIQIMGSWCANCLDETKFLTDYYKHNHARGVEIIALAYELTTDRERSKKSIEKFKKLFDVPYPMLITGVTASDEQKTEKTLPQLTPFRSFPTTIFIDKKGRVRDIQTSFYGPGSGEYYTAYKNEFYKTVNDLLNE
jgi:thiol-disulfide isomerase/thioredoxin